MPDLLGASPGTIAAFDDASWPEVQRIHAAGIAGGHATFDPALPGAAQFFASRVPELRLAWFAGTRGSGTDPQTAPMAGWIAATRVSPREVYRGVIEHSVYVDPAFAGQGIARALLEQFFANAKSLGYWTVQCSIFRENTASQALHEKSGFRQIGYRERVGLMSYGPLAGQWRDTLIYEKRL
ncbi:MAG: N-acetyltransferase [Renibacterium sp.]|nr:N-acetyltransferase [Renibacterium sp.]